MSGETDQTDGAQAASTEADEAGSSEELTPEAQAEAAWKEFDEADAAAEGGKPPAESKADESGSESSDSSGDPPPTPAEGEQSAEADAGKGESSSGDTDGASPAGDIWADAPSELRAAFEAEKSKASRAEQEIASNRGRISHLQARLDSLIAKPEQQDDTAGAGETSPDAGGSQDNAFESDAWKQFREDYADIAGPVQEVFSAQAEEIKTVRAENQRLRKGLETVGEDRVLARSDRLEAEVRETHPEYDEIIASEAFANWGQAAPAYIQQALHRNGEIIVDAAEASDLIARFKADTDFKGANGTEGGGSASTAGNGGDSSATAAATRRQIQLDSATGPSSKGGEAPTQDKEPETAEEAWSYWEKKDAQEAARASA